MSRSSTQPAWTPKARAFAARRRSCTRRLASASTASASVSSRLGSSVGGSGGDSRSWGSAAAWEGWSEASWIAATGVALLLTGVHASAMRLRFSCFAVGSGINGRTRKCQVNSRNFRLILGAEPALCARSHAPEQIDAAERQAAAAAQQRAHCGQHRNEDHPWTRGRYLALHAVKSKRLSARSHSRGRETRWSLPRL